MDIFPYEKHMKETRNLVFWGDTVNRTKWELRKYIV